MVNSSLNQDASSKEQLSLESEIKLAIETLLKQYKDPKKGIRILSKKMGIHEKTLDRILNNENKPSYQTVFKIFRVFYNEFNDAQVLKLAPDVVRNFLIKSNAQVLTPDKNYSSSADSELQKNPIIAELYILAATGPLHLDQVLGRFGSYGVELLGRMVDKGLLDEAHRNVYVLGTNHPVFDGNTIVSVGSVMVTNHAKPSSGDELGKNFISFFAEGLSEEAYRKWISIDQDAHEKKFELTRDPKNLGTVRAFTFMISEKIEINGLQ